MTTRTRIRFTAKPRGEGRARTWGVYDRDRGSWPAQLPGFGRVQQDLPTEARAQAEADRLEQHLNTDTKERS